MKHGVVMTPGMIKAKWTATKYDAIEHAELLIKTEGGCEGPVDCNICFRKTFAPEFVGCSPEDAYEDALRFLKENGDGRKCVSIW